MDVMGGETQDLRIGTRIKCQSVCNDILSKWHSNGWDSAIRNEDMAIRRWSDNDSKGFKFAKYKAWSAYDFGRCTKDREQLKGHIYFTSVVQTCAEVRTLAAFRCCSSWLNCESLRFKNIVRSQRHCQVCDVDVVDDSFRNKVLV